MENLNDFYQRILNINNEDKSDIIKNVVNEEKRELLLHSDTMEGFCKYMANQISCRLKDIPGIRTYLIDLNEIINFDHVALVAQFRSGEKLKNILIDATFEQFKSKENCVLYKLTLWPYDKLKNTTFFEALKNNGMFEVDDESFREYLKAFSNDEIDFSLTEYLNDINFSFETNNRHK